MEAKLSDLRGFTLLSEHVEELREYAATPQQRIPTGVDSLDKYILGPAQSEVYTLVARSHVGKSLMATNIMVNNPTTRIVFFSLEMTARHVLQHLYAHITDRSREEVTYMVLNNELPDDIDIVGETLRKQVVIDTSGLTLADMSMCLLAYESWFGERPQLVIIDYLEEVGGIKQSGEGWLRTEATASALKSWARDEHIAVFSLHQANQKTEPWEPPTQSSAKGGGYTESDVVVGMWRPGWDPELSSTERRERQHDVSFNVIKNRITGRLAAKIPCVITQSLTIVELWPQKTF